MRIKALEPSAPLRSRGAAAQRWSLGRRSLSSAEAFVSTSSAPLRLTSLLWVGPLTVLVSIVAVLVVRTVTVALLHPDPEFTPLSWDSSIVLTTVFVTSAVLVFVLVARFALNPIRTYRIIAAVVLMISFLPDIAVGRSHTAGANWPNAFALMTMHVTAWAVCVTMLSKLTASEQRDG